MMAMLTLQNLLAWSLQVALLVAAVLAAVRLLRLDVPAVHYGALRIVLVACLLLPLVQPLSVSAGAPGRAVTTQSVVPLGDGGTAASPAEGLTPIVSTYAPAGIVLLLIGGAIARLVWMGAGILRLRGLRRAGEVASASEEQDTLQRTIGTAAAIRYVRGLGQPVTFGVRRPVVLLPQSLLAQHPAIQRAVLAHELWHVRRRDWMWTVAEEGVRALLWFHPAIWILLSRIQAVREEVVDELTILSTGSRRGYVDALLVFADASPVFAATAFARRRHLVHRLMLISKEAVMSARRVVACCAVLGVVMVSAGWYSVQAFPLVRGQLIQDAFAGPGPVENRARPIRPENPIPRRTYHVSPQYPVEAAHVEARAVVTVRVTLDESGGLAESRVTGMNLTASNFTFTIQFSSGVTPGPESAGTSDAPIHKMERLLKSVVDAAHQADARRAMHAMGVEAVRAVSQWQYDRPADGPISFDVVVQMAPESDGPERNRITRQDGLPGGDAPQWGDALRVGGNIKPPMKTRHVNPVYPQDAQDAGATGVVIIEARIEPDGTVGGTRVLRSVPMLDEAAVDAVQQWTFTPTLLNGQPVALIMTVTVNFTLQ